VDESTGRPSARALALGQKLRVDVATADVVAALAREGISSLLLKGPALQRLHEPDIRNYGDIDLLVPAEHIEATEHLLDRRGFALILDEDAPGEAWRAHVWQRESDGVVVDVHRNLDGLRVAPGETWSVLAGDSSSMALGGAEVQVPSDSAAALIVCLHAAQHGPRWTRPQDDLRRAVERFPLATWKEAAAKAALLGASPAFAAALRLIPEGAALADELGLGGQTSRGVALSLADSDGLALSLERLVQTRGVGAKLRLLARELVPPRDVLVVTEPVAARGPAWIVLAYPVRIIRLLGRLPGAVRLWLRVQRQVRRAKRENKGQ
jgi:hypothetical protein